ncbi:MAG: hypothetical protein KC425_18780 [Anaerolineales bacterium]|nr:hypothetical protein [Anaerolineales bacterium]
MENLSQLVGLAPEQLTQLLILAVVLIVGLFVLRVFLKLTATLFRLGCFVVLLIVAAVYVLSLLGGPPA